MGGGNMLRLRCVGWIRGLSPRGRGKQSDLRGHLYRRGSIPAWAGETSISRKTARRRKVYPRVGGGNTTATATRICAYGLSPRGRGKRRFKQPLTEQVRSIPAWAGETPGSWRMKWIGQVYPRVGGGNDIPALTQKVGEGLSPRGRGKPIRNRPYTDAERSIPAWAGETRVALVSHHNLTVYPRVGGGNPGLTPIAAAKWGLSPRGRGKHWGK